MSIAVFGGNGFLGKKICEYGIKNGFKVTSFSKSGKPPVITNALREVNWKSANIFDTSTYENQLPDYDIVFHSIGKLFNDESYKQSLNSNSPLSVLKNLVNGSNPMTKTFESSFEGTNKYSVIKLLQAYETKKPDGKLVYVSADKQLPFIPKDYIRTKREAEHELLNSKLNALIIRPGIMYDSNHQNNRYQLVKALEKGFQLKNITIGENKCLDELIRPILSTDDVCRVLFDKLELNNQVITLNDILKSLNR